MITSRYLGKPVRGDTQGDCNLGNALFRIAGIIGTATWNGYAYGFPEWIQQEFFVNPLPRTNLRFPFYKLSATHFGFDFGFNGFNIPDNHQVDGEFGSWKYFEHCEGLIRHYLTMKDLCEPFDDCILIHYRDYPKGTAWTELTETYFKRALKEFPDKRVVCITDNIKVAKNALKLDCDYTSNSPIIDFHLLTKAKYLIMANSTFSWWGAYLSRADTVAPKNWFSGPLKDIDLTDLYLPNWKVL